MKRWLVCVGLLLGSALASADATVNGFITEGAGELRGTVTHDDGSPGANVKVHIVAPDGTERVVTSDEHGAFRVELGKGSFHVFIDEPGKVAGTMAVASGTSSEVIDIHDIAPPSVPAKAKKKLDYIPPYSDKAIDADTWTRAWLMLHVNERGKVIHVKLLESAGFDLDETAIREAFALEFTPALDRAKRAIPSIVVWTFEWPSYWWMKERSEQALTRLPAAVEDVPCRRADKPSKRDRDCRTVDMKAAATRPWLAPRKK